MNIHFDTKTLLLEALQQGQQFVTPNTRLASALHEWLDQLSLQSVRQEEVVRASPQVASFASWVDSLRSQLLLIGLIAPRKVLSPLAESALWQRAIDNSSSGQLLIAPALATSQAQQAHALLCLWGVDIESCAYEFNSQPESAALLEWVVEFRRLVDASGCIAHAQAQQEVLHTIEELRSTGNFELGCLSKTVCAVGFQTPTPLQKKLLSEFSKAQPEHDEGSVLGIQLRASCEQVNVVRTDTTESEIAAAAHWAKKTKLSQPTASVAIVVPDLEQRRIQVERIMRQVFEPETRHLGKISKANSYNISAGSSLDTTPLVGAYLDVLHSVLLKLDIGRWLGLLHSPHLWGQVCTQKSVVSVKLITAMYEAGQSEYSAADLHKLLQWAKIKLPEQDTAGSNFSAQLATLVGKAQTLKLSRNRNKRAPLSKWLAEFNALLSALGWSQSRTLDTVEFQQLQRFNECIVDCASNDAVISEITAIQAYRLLLRHFRDTVFHRQTLLSGNTLPDVLGVLEAGGQVFDYVWLCGFSDAQWPQKSKADALLPKAFQQRLAMPFASEQRELVYTKALTHSLLHASGHCTVSYPISVDDTPAQLSPLVLRVLDDMQSSATKVNYLDETQNDVFKPGSAGLLACKENSASLFENVDDSSGSPLDTKSLHNGKAVKGGTGFLQAMASNPLRAYLRYRLELVALPAPLVGITALERGIVLHSVLERCWSELKNLQTLKSVDDAALAKRLQQWIDDQLGDLLRRRFSRVPQALVDVECKVLTDILQHWLQLERQRTDFEVIATEFDIHYELSGLPFRGRIDRIDKLANGTSLLIDYKSGATNVAGWLDEALLEPQLPFYAIALKQAKQNSLINGISFASLKPSAIGFKGLTADNDKSTEISGIRALSDTEIEAVESWQNLQVIWQQRLTEIAHQIKTGFAGLDSETEWSNDDYQPLTRASYFKELVQ